MQLSVIIPTLNEFACVSAAVSSALRAGADEVLVVDGGSSDGTERLALEAGARVITSARGRGTQIHQGLLEARGTWVVFLHADSQLPAEAREGIGAAERLGALGGAFLVRFTRGGWVLKAVEAGINLRSRLGRSCTGDQAQFFRRAELMESGGVPQVPLMEDLLLWRRMRALGPMTVVRSRVRTSPRRFEGRTVRTLLFMWGLRVAHRAGVSPSRLARWYGRQLRRDR